MQFNNIQVSRRYKHFDWLHERLEDKFCFIPIPPLPDKQISGRYEEQFIEHRRTQLQEFVDYVCRHPVLSRSRVWQHFITCTDEKRWKAGKRQAEKDELLGLSYFHGIQAPDTPLDAIKIEFQTDAFARLRLLLCFFFFSRVLGVDFWRGGISNRRCLVLSTVLAGRGSRPLDQGFG